MGEPTPEPPTGRGPPPPARQKSFICENAGILDLETKRAILRLVMMEAGSARDRRPVVLEQGAAKEVSIDLDVIENLEVVLQLYNIVSHRRASLNEPMREAGK